MWRIHYIGRLSCQHHDNGLNISDTWMTATHCTTPSTRLVITQETSGTKIHMTARMLEIPSGAKKKPTYPQPFVHLKRGGPINISITPRGRTACIPNTRYTRFPSTTDTRANGQGFQGTDPHCGGTLVRAPFFFLLCSRYRVVQWADDRLRPKIVASESESVLAYGS